MAWTTRSAPNPSSSGGSAALRWIQKALKPAEAAPATSQEFDDTNRSSALLTPSLSAARPYTRGLGLKILTSSTLMMRSRRHGSG